MGRVIVEAPFWGGNGNTRNGGLESGACTVESGNAQLGRCPTPAGHLPAWLGTQLRPQGHRLVLLGECALLVFGATSPNWGHPGACPSLTLPGRLWPGGNG